MDLAAADMADGAIGEALDKAVLPDDADEQGDMLWDTWNEAEKRFVKAVFEKRAPAAFLVNNLWDAAKLFRMTITAQIIAEKDEQGYKSWQLHHDPEYASQRSWARIVRVNHGFQRRMFSCYGTKAHSTWTDWVDERDADPSWIPFAECLCGEELVDLVAVSADFSKCYGSLLGHGVLGWPYEPILAGEQPVRVFRDAQAWWKGNCKGVVLIGTAEQNLWYLQRCENGIVCDDIAHGKAVQKMLRRPYEGPRVLVAQ